MNIEETRDKIAEELGAVHEIISTIMDRVPSDRADISDISCSDNVVVLLEYAKGYTEAAFQHLNELT